jgi:uncharacterized protein YggE
VSIKVNVIGKGVLALLCGLALSACQVDASLQTQVSAKAELLADEYIVFVEFKHQGVDQKKLMVEFSGKTDAFMRWANDQSLQMLLSAERLHLQPVYEYPANKPRQRVSFEVSQQFKVSGLSLHQYSEILPQLASLNAHAFGQWGVKVSDGQAVQTRQRLVTEAFEKSQQKANHLAQLSNLCELSVLEIKEFDQDGGQPRMMMMEAKGSSVAPSQQTLSVRLDIKWQASPC